MTADRTLLALALLGSGAVLACGDKDDDTGATQVSADWADVETALANSCAFSSCHGGGQFPDLTVGNSYAALVGVASEQAAGEILVVPEDPDGSYLVKKIEAAAGIVDSPMPQGSADGWTGPEIAMVRAWIAAGATQD